VIRYYLLNLPVTAATADRNFSKLKILNNYLRSSIYLKTQLVGLATHSIESEFAEELDMDELIQSFAHLKQEKSISNENKFVLFYFIDIIIIMIFCF